MPDSAIPSSTPRRSLTALFVVLAMTGCGKSAETPAPATSAPASATPPAPPTPSPAAQSVPQQLPALYSGTLPCADCPGIRYELDLRANNVFVMRMTYLEKTPEVTRDDIGQWSIEEDRTLVLTGGGEVPESWSIRDVDTLTKLDRDGKPIASNHNYSIVRQSAYVSLEPKLAMRGMYRYMADAALFEECHTGLKLPIAAEGDNAALETAYATVKHEPGAPVLASVEGSIAPRPAMEGDEPVQTLVVDKFLRFWPNESCGARGVTHELASTRWVLTRLNDEPIDSRSLGREPFLALESQERRVVGFAGCNRIIGGYEADDTKIRFTQLAMTRMACPHMAFESAYEKALNATAAWKITGAHLELFDANGAVVARFEERNL